MTNTKILTAIGILIIFSNFSNAQSKVDKSVQIKQSLHKTVLEVHNKQQNVGLAAVLISNNQILFSDYLGLGDIENNVKIHEESKFGIASITKLFTAVIILKLEANSTIDLDGSVQQYFPELTFKSKSEITIRMLLTHQSGIPHPNNRTPKLYSTNYKSAIEAMEIFASDSLLFEPGTDAKYSSSNYNLLAAIIERITEKSFTDVVKELVLVPMDLNNTRFDNVLRQIPNRVRRYSFYHPWTYQESDTLYSIPIWDYSFNLGGGNIISTASDLAKFGTFLLEPIFLPKKQWEYLFSDALFGAEYEKGAYIYASGANQGLQAGLAIYPIEKISTAVLSNTWGKGSRSGEMTKLAIVLSEEFTELSK